jgi:hypothetical protein
VVLRNDDLREEDLETDRDCEGEPFGDSDPVREIEGEVELFLDPCL